MNKVLHNRIKQVEQKTATMKQATRRGPFNLGMLYDRIHSAPETLSQVFQQLLHEMSDTELMEQCGHHVDKGFSLSLVPTEILLKAGDSKHPDKVLAGWRGSQP